MSRPQTDPTAQPGGVFARLVGHTRETRIVGHLDRIEADAIATAQLAIAHAAEVVHQADCLRKTAGLPLTRRNVTAIGAAFGAAFSARLLPSRGGE